MYLSDNDRRAQASYDRMLAAGPAEAPLFNVMADYSIDVSPRKGFTLDKLTKVLGGEAHFAGEGDNGHLAVSGSTEVEEVDDVDDAREIMLNLLSQVSGVDMDDPDITITGPEEEDFIDPRDED